MGSHKRINGSDPGFAIDDIPNQPTVGTVTLTSATATIPVTAATSGGRVTYYKATSNPGSLTNTSSSSTVTIAGLSPSTSYTFTVQTGNPWQLSPASGASNSVTVGSDTAYIVTASGYAGWTTPCIDSSGNFIFGGYKNLTGYKGFVSKFDTTNTRAWETQVTPTSGNFYASYTGVDSSGNIYMAGSWDANGNDMYLVKFNSSGVLQWQRNIGDSYSQDVYKLIVDSSGNTYLVGYHYLINTQYRAYIIKYNTSGTKQWDYTLRYGTSAASFFYDVYYDGSLYIYLTGYCNDNTGYTGGFVLKIDTGAGLYWIKTTRDYANNASGYGYAITADTSNNTFLSGSSNSLYYIVKHNSSGTVQWWRRWSTSILSNYFQGITTDSSGNVYAMARVSNAQSYNAIYVVKMDSTGAIQWERTLAKNNQTNDITATKFATISGSYLIFASTSGEIFKFPTDGSLTGTYTVGSNTYTWASTSLTSTTTALDSRDLAGYSWESSGLATGTPTFTTTSTTYSSTAFSRF